MLLLIKLVFDIVTIKVLNPDNSNTEVYNENCLEILFSFHHNVLETHLFKNY